MISMSPKKLDPDSTKPEYSNMDDVYSAIMVIPLQEFTRVTLMNGEVLRWILHYK